VNTAAEHADFFRTLSERSAHGTLRGDYSQCDEHYVVRQDWQAYTSAQHALWRRLYRRQAALLPGRACEVFIASLDRMDAAQEIPLLARTSEALYRATRWQLVPVPGLVPDRVFFEHLAQRRFPVTVWLREPEEFDYIVEPDLFHDFFGHVPLLFDPVFADYMQQYGQGGLRALELGGLEYLARLYWYTVEFGLIRSPAGLRVYGAGILSSGGEIVHCLSSPGPHRIAFHLERTMRTRYRIDSYQQTYFVIDSFEQLFDQTARDFAPLYAVLERQAALEPQMMMPGEESIAPVQTGVGVGGIR